MPTPTHQDLVRLFHSHPEVAFELARRAGAPLGHDYTRLEIVHAEFDDPLRPGNTVRADAAIVAYKGEKRRLGLIFEVQLADDWAKQWSTVLYRAGLRYLIERPAWAVMFSPDPDVRRNLSRRGYRLEPELRPPIVTPEKVPDIRELSAALASYPWAILSAIMHTSEPAAVTRARVAIQALLRLTPRHHARYVRLIANLVGKEVMQLVRKELPRTEREQLSAIERRGGSFNLGLDEGREQGRDQTLREALAAARRTLDAVLKARGLDLDEPTEARIAACTDLQQVHEWIVRAATITSLEQLFD